MPSPTSPLPVIEQLLAQGQPAAALEQAREALAQDEYSPEPWRLMAECATQLRDNAEAEHGWRRLISLVPDDAAAHHSLGLLLAHQGHVEEAEACYRRSLELAPGSAAPHTNLGLLLTALGRDAEAEQHQRTALALFPDSPNIHSNLAALLAKRGAMAEAEHHYREAIRLAPDLEALHSNLGVLLNDLGRYAAAEACFRRVLASEPGHVGARLNLGQLLLAEGQFAEGWPLYEARYESAPILSWMDSREHARCQPWHGEPLAGKSILVLCEQGYGDEIQFCRYLPWLKSLGATHVTLVCRPPLRMLMNTLAGPDQVITRGEAGAVLDEHDYWVFLLSLPLHHGTRFDNVPGIEPYLHADPELIAHWTPQLPAGDFRIGLAWQGSPLHSNDAGRSLPDLALLSPLWSAPCPPGLTPQFVSLRPERAPEDGKNDALPLTDLGSLITDFADTAAIVAQLDLVICVDTALAHLAGALGKPCWMLLPACQTDWRWMRGRNDTPWYPTLRLFRQPRRGDWATPIQAMAKQLGRLLQAYA